MDSYLLFRMFLEKNKVQATSEQRYHLFHLFDSAKKIRAELLDRATCDESLFPYGLSRKQAQAYREFCKLTVKNEY